MKNISTNKAPIPAGHYSQAIEHNGIVYVSGQLPINPEMDVKNVGSIEEQTTQVLKNIEQILIAANSDISRIIKVTIYVSDISLWGNVNEVYRHFMGDLKPARVVVPTRDLHYGYQIEVDVIAAVFE